MSSLADQLSIPLLVVGCSQNRLLWHGFASSVRRWGFSMPGELGNEIDKTKVTPSHVLQRIVPLRYGCNPILFVGQAAEPAAIATEALI
jgi:hypothetical protein